ncbi:cation diffusion facilitator family transporter [Cryobacterium tepidiphilum]|uniref:Cation transporter n=1 Tax=Cryobacterium tepidiphilum TaxID=2486026 RepID=A0A3M8L0G1_9MICO|nr:cation diffusion facilitator family transporter [Cryobacterium tepidiphilum]RNE59031.1 cation transporter [Cryobacterium tepidiphilum]
MGHEHGAHADRRRLSIAIATIACALVVQAIGAWVTGSLALLADAGHMLSDLAGLGIALTATIVAARPATDRQTFGYQRAEVFGALLNGFLLVAVTVTVAVGAIGRLLGDRPAHVDGGPMLVVALIGLAANIAVLLMLRPRSGGSINMRGAYLEVLGDVLGSLAVVVAAVVIVSTGLSQADAIASLVIAVMIVPRAYLLLRDVVGVLSESAPAHTDVAVIRDHILATDGVVGVHDVHAWAITSGAPVFSAHVVVEERALADTGKLLDELSECLADHFDVEHSTFQLEPVEHAEHEDHRHR